MPVCFQLTRKSDMESGPVALQRLDEEMCQHFNAPCDADKWHASWYDIIGFRLACGDSFERIDAMLREWLAQDTLKMNLRLAAHDSYLLEINTWLNEHFTTASWWESKQAN